MLTLTRPSSSSITSAPGRTLVHQGGAALEPPPPAASLELTPVVVGEQVQEPLAIRLRAVHADHDMPDQPGVSENGSSVSREASTSIM